VVMGGENDPVNHTKQLETQRRLVRVLSCEFVDRSSLMSVEREIHG